MENHDEIIDTIDSMITQLKGVQAILDRLLLDSRPDA
jgi:hypothetical protein